MTSPVGSPNDVKYPNKLGGTLPEFAAQGLTLAAAIFPIFIGRDDVLVFLLTVTAPVTIIVHAVVWVLKLGCQWPRRLSA